MESTFKINVSETYFLIDDRNRRNLWKTILSKRFPQTGLNSSRKWKQWCWEIHSLHFKCYYFDFGRWDHFWIILKVLIVCFIFVLFYLVTKFLKKCWKPRDLLTSRTFQKKIPLNEWTGHTATRRKGKIRTMTRVFLLKTTCFLKLEQIFKLNILNA